VIITKYKDFINIKMPKYYLQKKHMRSHVFRLVKPQGPMLSHWGSLSCENKKINSWWFMPRKVVDLSWNDLGFSPRAIQNRLRLLICLIA